MMTRKSATLLIVVAIYAMFIGCRQYVYTESITTLSHYQSKQPNIVASPEYSQVAKMTRNVAIKAPDLCYGQAASASNKHTNLSKDIVRSKCGVEMSIVERKLTEIGYNVYSWEMLESMARAEEKSHLECAKQLGAEVLFAINSLETIVASDNNDPLKRFYYYSDNAGIKKEPRIIGEYHKGIIRNILKPYESSLYSSSLGATIDVTAIEVKTGKSIWFFKASAYNLEHHNDQITAAFVGRKGRWSMFKFNDNNVITRNELSHSEYDRPKIGNADIYFQKYIENVVSEFITAFKSGVES